MNPIADYIRLRDKALRTLDVNLARAISDAKSSDEIILIGLHKARVEATSIDRGLRLESVEWLRARGIKRMFGQPLPAPGELPE